ncbi:hypothetical protein MQE36_04875 [Zhouia spongiae]|uniref:Peptidase M12B domain-containing protein n=1 Tax=Zhouia spongiae TaxID=2202721 RepID=A0ABY3YPA7_9FLAO|nr:hypothetical protein [Zhouia spongiae]UNY99682.1 hypothetical protein MQE36_04875 [Zhouia spongiae]
MKLLFKSFVCSFLILSCSDSEHIADIQVKTYSFDSESNSNLMFQDDEEQELMVSEWRTYEISKVIRVKAVDHKTIEVANFTPVDLEDVTILANIEGVEGSVNLFKISKIRAHGKQEIDYPFTGNTSLFLNSRNEEVDLSIYKETGIAPDKITFDFSGDSQIIQQLKSLGKLNWKIKYHDFDPDNDPGNNWAEDISPKDVRRFTGLMINLGMVFASDAFKNEFIDEIIVGNDGVTQLTKGEKEAAYNAILNKERYNCGKVVNVSGLGGGATLGFAEHILRDYIRKETGFITAHEIGHTIGYNHSSNMTYPHEINGISTGISPVTTRIMNRFFESGSFPVTPENYYMPSDFE